MNPTETDFEVRFFQKFSTSENLPPPDARTRDLFVYPSHLKTSNKRRAPAPPSETGKTEHNSYLININYLGPVLKKYATLPGKTTNTSTVILTTDKTKLRNTSSTSKLPSALKSTTLFSAQMNPGTLKTGHREKDNHGNLLEQTDKTLGKYTNTRSGFREIGNSPPFLDTDTKSGSSSNKQESNSSINNHPNQAHNTEYFSPSREDKLTYRAVNYHENIAGGKSLENVATVLHEENPNGAANNDNTFSNFTYGCHSTSGQNCSLNRNETSCLHRNNTGKEKILADVGCDSHRDSVFQLSHSRFSESGLVQNNLTQNNNNLYFQYSSHQSTNSKFNNKVRGNKYNENELPSYYVKQNPIYEEVDETMILGQSQLPHKKNSDPKDRLVTPSAPANSPAISHPPHLRTYFKYNTLDINYSRRRKTPPPKPPRNRKLGYSKSETNLNLDPTGVYKRRHNTSANDKNLTQLEGHSPVNRIEKFEAHGVTQKLEQYYSETSLNLDPTGVYKRRHNTSANDVILTQLEGHSPVNRIEELETHGVTQKLEQYYFGRSLESCSPKQLQAHSSPSIQAESTPNVSASDTGPPKSHHPQKKHKKSVQSRAQALSKSFKYLLVTKFGNFKLTGKTYLSKGKEKPAKNNRSSRRASFLSVREKMRPKSPTPKRINSFHIPRIIVDCEPSGWVNDDDEDDTACSYPVKETNDFHQSSVTLRVNPKAVVEIDYSPTDEKCPEKCCSLCANHSFHEEYIGDEDKVVFSSKSNNNCKIYS